MNNFFKYLFIIQLVVATNVAIGQSFSSEGVYLQTDRDIYIAGEQLFFKCYSYSTETKKPLATSKYAYLVLRNEQNALISSICLKLENNMFSGSIYLPDTLSTGRYQLVSYTNCMRNQGEQLFFTKEILVANRFDKELVRIYNTFGSADTFNYKRINSFQKKEKDKLILSTEKQVYTKREKIKFHLEGPGIQDNEIANLSISVHEKVPLSSDSGNDNPSPIHLDNLVQIDPKLSCTYLPEINGIILQGKINNVDNQNAIPKAIVFLSVPDTIANLQFTQTDQSGIFKFQLNDYYIDKNIILNLPDLKKANIELDNKFNLTNPFRPSKHFPDSMLKDFIIKSQNIVQVQKTYKIESRQDILVKQEANAYVPLLYPPVNDAVYPADFVSLPDFVEISREILPLLKTRKHKGLFEARMVDLTNSQFFDSDPLIFLDGVPINNVSQIIALGTEKVNKVESVGVERYYGGLYFSGVLAVFTKKMEINNITWQTPMLSTKFVSLQPSSIFVGPSYSKTNKEPDFRQLLYWAPFVTVKANETKDLEFQASDNKGEYIITVEGITSDGNFVSANSTFKIGNNLK